MKNFPLLSEEHFSSPTLGLLVAKQYKKMLCTNFMLSISEPDNCCSVDKENIVIDQEDRITIIGQKLLEKSDFYRTPSFSDIGIYLVTNLSPVISYYANVISRLDFGAENVIFPLSHLK